MTTWNIYTIFEHQKKHLNEVVKVKIELIDTSILQQITGSTNIYNAEKKIETLKK